MGNGRAAPGGAEFVKLEPRSRRRMRENFKKAFIWVFLAFFVFTIVGTIVMVAPR